MLNARWTIALWVILIILFVAFYQIFSGPHEGAPVPPPDPREPSPWVSIFTRTLPVVFLVLFGFFYFFALRRQSPLHEGSRLLTQGRYLQALEQFEMFRKVQPRVATAAYNCGISRLLLWKLESAISDLEAAQRLGGLGQPHLKILLSEQLTLAFALVGRTSEAHHMLRQLSDSSESAHVALASAVLLARNGDWAAARTKLATLEVKRMWGTTGALARALDALCIEQLTEERRYIDRVALFGEASPDELRKHWPEFVAFVERAPAW
jgi:tetratricopeptide (TPR) repeat protein